MLILDFQHIQCDYTQHLQVVTLLAAPVIWNVERNVQPSNLDISYHEHIGGNDLFRDTSRSTTFLRCNVYMYPHFHRIILASK